MQLLNITAAGRALALTETCAIDTAFDALRNLTPKPGAHLAIVQPWGDCFRITIAEQTTGDFLACLWADRFDL